EGGDGLELLEDVRNKYPNMPFIIFTQEENGTVASKAISTGVTDYLIRPSEIDSYAELANRVQEYVDADEFMDHQHLKSRYRNMANTSPAPVAIYNDQGKLSYVNDAAANLVEAEERDEVVGSQTLDFVHPDDQNWAKKRMGRVLKEREKVPQTELRLVSTEGNTKHAVVATEPITYQRI
ncbi:MAG: PAS domain S-box protein, partial [Halobacteria archaeon]|nr:PAS domain S-box protein [Halobacteria archaeon]